MAANVPWSVNAVEPETWATARDAARRSGLSVGEWLEAAIRGSADDRTVARAAYARPAKEQFQHQLNDISERLDQMMDRDAPRSRGRRERTEADLAHSIDALTDRIETLIGDIRDGDRSEPYQIKTAIDRLDSRIETLFAQGKHAAPAADPEIERKLSGIAREIEMMGRRIEQENARFPGPGIAPSLAELDAAIAEITVRQSALDDGASSRDLDRKLASIDTRFGFTPRSDVQLVGLEQQIKQLADEMQALRRASVQSDSFEALRREIGDLAHTFGDLTPRRSIEALERTVAGLATRIDRIAHSDRQGNAGNAGEIVDALQEIRGALAEVKPAESFAAVQHDLRTLSEKLDGLNERGIDSGTLGRLQSQTSEIRDLLSNALPGDALKTLVGHIETLVRRVEHAPSPNEGAVLDVLSSLERRIDSFAERVETVTRQPASVPALDEIKSRLEQIEGALDHGNRGASGGLESSMKSLVDKLDHAEARLTNLGSLERGLNDLFGQMKGIRASAVEVAERAARAPEPAHQIPSRAPEARARPSFEAEAKPLVAMRDFKTVASPASAPSLPEAIAPGPKTAVVTSSAEGDYPLEPGSGSPRGKSAQSAAERVALSEAALGGIHPVADQPGSTADYIAAARRAAQAAAAKQTVAAEIQTSKPKTGLASLLGSQKRPIMLGVLLILIMFTAVRFGGLGSKIPFLHSATPAPAVIKAPVKTPAPAVQPPAKAAPEDHSELPVNNRIAFAETSAIKMVAPNLTSSLLAADMDPQTTGSIDGAKTAKAPAPANIIAPLPAASTQHAELPAAIGTVALRMAALAGDPAAAYEIGTRWFDGTGVAPSTTEAKRWFEMAAAKGSIPAAYRLGNIYEKGHGTAKNLAEAQRYYTLAAEAGNAKAMHNLAVLYSEGIDGKPDYKTAAHWFRMAAERNVRDSQYNLAVLYARGAGVERNFAESFRWFAIAAAQNDPDALKKRDSVAKHLDAKTLEAARLAVQHWKAIPLDEATNHVALDPLWLKAEASARKKSVNQ